MRKSEAEEWERYAKTMDYWEDEGNVKYSKRINQICRECSSPNWDGHGAEPIEDKSVQFVCEFLEMLPDDIPSAQLVPGINGDLAMVWFTKKNEEIFVKIDKAGTIKWETDTAGGEAKMGECIPKAVIEVLRAV